VEQAPAPIYFVLIGLIFTKRAAAAADGAIKCTVTIIPNVRDFNHSIGKKLNRPP